MNYQQILTQIKQKSSAKSTLSLSWLKGTLVLAMLFVRIFCNFRFNEEGVEGEKRLVCSFVLHL